MLPTLQRCLAIIDVKRLNSTCVRGLRMEFHELGVPAAEVSRQSVQRESSAAASILLLRGSLLQKEFRDHPLACRHVQDADRLGVDRFGLVTVGQLARRLAIKVTEDTEEGIRNTSTDFADWLR